MKYNIKNLSRIFKVGTHTKFNFYDCGDIYLKDDEQITLDDLQ